jgi:four helix bundle protein
MSKKFEDLDAFKRALDLVADVYEVTESFPRTELYGMTSQVRRAAMSIVNHIAEGQGRLTLGEWRQMLSQARGSLYEVQAQLIASERLGFLKADKKRQLEARSADVARPLAGLIRYVQRREQESKRRLSNQQPATSHSP